MRQRTWLDDEPGLAALLRDGALLFSAGWTRPWLSALVAVAVATISLSATLLFASAHAPRYVLRVVEMDRDPATMPRPPRQLSEYVREAVFTGPVLQRVIEAPGLYSSLARNNPQAALESFREDIDVQSYQNYFVEERGSNGAPRSVRLVVSFRSKDRAQALAVTRDLGKLVVEQERERRRQQAARAVRDMDVVLDRAQRVLSERRGSVVRQRLEIEASPRPSPMRQVELVSLLGSLSVQEDQVEVAEKRKSQLELALAAERRGVGLYFEVVDDGQLPRATVFSVRPLTKRAATLFLLALPLALVGVGAFANRKGEES
jgi:hypothetical protein